MQEWKNNKLKELQSWATQQDIARKYKGLQGSNQVHTHLEQEMKFRWLFPKTYQNVAVPIEEVDADAPIADGQWSLDWAFQQMRKRHAEECFRRWVAKHQDAFGGWRA